MSGVTRATASSAAYSNAARAEREPSTPTTIGNHPSVHHGQSLLVGLIIRPPDGAAVRADRTVLSRSFDPRASGRQTVHRGPPAHRRRSQRCDLRRDTIRSTTGRPRFGRGRTASGGPGVADPRRVRRRRGPVLQDRPRLRTADPAPGHQGEGGVHRVSGTAAMRRLRPHGRRAVRDLGWLHRERAGAAARDRLATVRRSAVHLGRRGRTSGAAARDPGRRASVGEAFVPRLTAGAAARPTVPYRPSSSGPSPLVGGTDTEQRSYMATRLGRDMTQAH